MGCWWPPCHGDGSPRVTWLHPRMLLGPEGAGEGEGEAKRAGTEGQRRWGERGVSLCLIHLLGTCIDSSSTRPSLLSPPIPACCLSPPALSTPAGRV